MTDTKQPDLEAEIARLAKHGPHAVEAFVREHNTRTVPEAREKARLRTEERERYVLRRGLELREAWEAEQRRQFARQAAEEFDAGRPPIAVPERIEMDEARRIAAAVQAQKKGTKR